MQELETQIELTYTEAQLEMFFNIPGDVRYEIVTKGRRFGATMGASHAFIEWGIGGKKMLWGDTIHSNIDRYFQRYFYPALKKTGVRFKYLQQQKQLHIEGGYIDFRSADNPQNWEGFGYDVIFLNEAGIILKDKYIYTNAVLPMLLDNKDSLLIAAGVPKGKMIRNNEEHPFYTLYKMAKNNQKNYHLLEFSSYDNPLISKKEAELLEDEIRRMSPMMVEQEIYGKFIDADMSSTLWSPGLIHRIQEFPEFRRVVIAVDPSGSIRGNEIGIITCGISNNGNIYVLKDLSGHFSPLQWAKICVNEYRRSKADSIIVERNFGGDMVKANIHNVDNMIRIQEAFATREKAVRAEPIVGLYEKGLIFHAEGLHTLENEMLTWIPGTGKSPNRVDALVWGVTALKSRTTQNIKELEGYFF